MAIPVVWAYFLSERRAAFIGFALGMLLFSMLLFRLERRVFWWFVPIVGILAWVTSVPSGTTRARLASRPKPSRR